MGVRRLDVASVKDGRQRLTVEFDDENRTRFVYYGQLTAELEVDRHSTIKVNFFMQAQTGGDPIYFGQISVDPPKPEGRKWATPGRVKAHMPSVDSV